MFRQFFCVLLWLGCFSSLCAQDKDNLKKPLEAVIQSMGWSSVLTRDHDVTATVHFGSNDDNEGGPSQAPQLKRSISPDRYTIGKLLNIGFHTHAAPLL